MATNPLSPSGKPSRRAIFAAATLVPAASVRGSAANSALNVGLIGAGNRGTYLAQLVAAHTPARIAAISELFDDRIEAARKKIPGADQAAFHRDYRDLLASNVDAVIIATPVFLHAEHFEAAVRARKHIYIEKPAAASVADCKRILKAADSAPRSLHITFGFQRRHGQVYRKAKAVLDTGAIGRIRWANVQFIKGEPASRRPRTGNTPPADETARIRDWGAWRETSGDLIVENNIHLIDVMNWFLGAHPLSAHGTGGRTMLTYGDNRDHVHVTFDYPGDVQGSLLGTILAPGFYRNVSEQFHGPSGVIETSENYWKHYRGREDVTAEKSPRNISIDSVADFVQRIAEARPENTGARGVESTLTAILGRMAMDLGRKVTWEEIMRSA